MMSTLNLADDRSGGPELLKAWQYVGTLNGVVNLFINRLISAFGMKRCTISAY